MFLILEKRKSISYNPSFDNPTSINNQEFQWRVRQVSLNFTYRFNQKKKSTKKQIESSRRRRWWWRILKRNKIA